MHVSIRDRLEDLLRADSLRGYPATVNHLNTCAECSSELDLMKDQCAQLKKLRAAEDLEPAAGFYARVLQRIEERQGESIWSIFMASPFSKRLAVASLTIAVALGSYVVAQESRETLPKIHLLALGTHENVPVTGSQDERREAVLANFAAHRFTGGQGQLQ